MNTCPAHGVAVNQGEPESQFYRIQQRISDRFGPDVAAAFMEAVVSIRDNVDMNALESAIRAGEFARIESALGIGGLAASLQQREGVRGALQKTFGAMGEASGQVLVEELGVSFSFDARDPNAITFARSQTATLVSRISDDQRAALRTILGRAQQEGIPPRRSARAIHKVVGLREDWAQAPLNIAQEIREGQAAAATSRRLDGATKAKIRSRIANDTVDEAFIDEVTETYTHSLRRRRALDIARTETIRASSAGREESWRQAQGRGVLPDTARRFWVVTPDDRLRASHAAIPGMNPDGVPVGEPFETPFGAIEYPPAEPNCRCSVALMPNPETGGMIGGGEPQVSPDIGVEGGRVTVTDEGERAIADFIEVGEQDRLREWLDTPDGKAYLHHLHEQLPDHITVHRGLNGVLDDDHLRDAVGAFEDFGPGNDVDASPGIRKPSPGSLVSYTDDKRLAEKFATGEIHFIENPKPFGTVIEDRFPADRVVYHHEHVDLRGRFEEEREVTVWFPDQ